jgi:arylsulfatase A-like enzyme
MTSRVDDQLGRVLAAVDAAGQRNRTVTFHFTDHGEYLGDFGLVEKWPSGLDDCLLHNPLIVHDPNAPSAVASALVELIDLTPTLLEYAELDAGHTHFGRSFQHLVDDPTGPHRAAVFSEGGFLASEAALLEPDSGGHDRHKRDIQRECPELVAKAAAVRTTGWTYIERLEEGDELYDRCHDPHETANVVADPALADVVAEHRDLIMRWALETSDVFPWTPDPRRERTLRESFRA